MKTTPRERVNDFKASTIEEIKAFKPNLNESFKIVIIDTCPFTNIEDTATLIASITDIRIHGSEFNNCFIYTDEYGNDGIVSFENALILQKYQCWLQE